ncbi:MAG: GNAT family N-acetyltransferase [Planctomycetes bacterium]|nr:GNAT family N-acetyltransferase [Planctomycetota bacterium]
MTDIRAMDATEVGRIGEIDRSEHITQQYRVSDGVLELVDVDIHALRWGAPGGIDLQELVEAQRPRLDAGGVLLGAFDGDALVGFAIFDTSCADEPAILSALYVTRTHRGRGIAVALTDAVVRLARAVGAPRLYVSATPTRTTVDFYLARGFRVLVTPNPRLLAHEPEDVHLALDLRRGGAAS